MIRMELGSIAEGVVGVAKVFLDGGGRLAYGSSGGEAAQVWNVAAPTPGESFQEYASPAAAEAAQSADVDYAATEHGSGEPEAESAPAVSPSPAISEVELSSDITLLPTLRFKPPFKQAFPWIVPATEHVVQRAKLRTGGPKGYWQKKCFKKLCGPGGASSGLAPTSNAPFCASSIAFSNFPVSSRQEEKKKWARGNVGSKSIVCSNW
jgi:hypothetical protein